MTRTTFTVSRAAEFFSEKELEMQMGAGRYHWLPMLLKELIDNALDACEGAGVVPSIKISTTDDTITVSDNGPGIPASTVEKSLDYLSRTSSNNLWISPTRGQLGNALKCLYAAGYVANGKGSVVITAQGVRHTITVGFDEIQQEPTLSHDTETVEASNGTSVQFLWSDDNDGWARARAWRIGLFNPHAFIEVNGDTLVAPQSDRDFCFSKWKPDARIPVSWFYRHQFKALLCAHINASPEMYVRDFIKLFAGMSSTWAQSAVLDDLRLQRISIKDAFTRDGEVHDALVEQLHDVIDSYCGEPPKAKRLGTIGKGVLSRLEQLFDVRPDSGAYAKVAVEDHCRPFVAEAWFGASDNCDTGRELVYGINNSIVSVAPSDLIREVLADNLIDSGDPVTVVLHLVCPGFHYVDRGKSRIAFSDEQEQTITTVLTKVCKKWKSVKSRLRRDQRASQRELERLSQKSTTSAKEAAWAVMEDAYLKASGNGAYPANARQVMYAARGAIQELTGKPLSDQYFTQTLLPDFQIENPELTASWDVVYDDRGHLVEPHTGRNIPLGTVNVRQYVNGWTDPQVGDVELSVPLAISTSGPAGCYSAAIFIEKEGFTALFDKARTRDLFDVAIFSTKGMSNTASRQLVDKLSSQGVPIFLLHDFDAAGMTIARTIRSDSRRYKFDSEPEVIDLGLRLEQAMGMDLESEEFQWPARQKQDPTDNLKNCGATPDELAFLVEGQKGGRWTGKRIELNAMTAPQFVEFVHGELEAQGISKVLPDEDTLSAAFQHVCRRNALKVKIDELFQRAESDDQIFTTPDDLRDQVLELIEGTDLNWKDAVIEIAENS